MKQIQSSQEAEKTALEGKLSLGYVFVLVSKATLLSKARLFYHDPLLFFKKLNTYLINY
jgi:hypothetical protein